jgi:F0F1-type ATP synthase assembly protein I
MKPHPNTSRVHRATGVSRATADDNLGHGMDLALTIALFLGIGLLLDYWLGTSPLCTIVMIVIAAVGCFTRMKYSYDASMERLEAERRQRMQPARHTTIEDPA